MTIFTILDVDSLEEFYEAGYTAKGALNNFIERTHYKGHVRVL